MSSATPSLRNCRCTKSAGRGALVIRIDGAALAAKRVQRLAGFGKGHQPVVNHAPDVAKHDIDAADEVAQLLDEAQLVMAANAG